MRHQKPGGQQCQHHGLHTQNGLPKALFILCGITVCKYIDERNKQVSGARLQKQHRLRHRPVNANGAVAPLLLQHNFGQAGRRGGKRRIDSQRRTLEQQSAHRAFFHRLRVVKPARHTQGIGTKHCDIDAQHQHQCQKQLVRGRQHAYKHRQRHQAAQRIGFSHQVQPAGLLADGVVYICNRFHHAVCMVKQNAGALQRTVGVFCPKGARQCEHHAHGASQRHCVGAAADITALRVFFVRVRHLEIVHAIRGNGKENARCADGRGKNARLLCPRQAENQNAEQKMAYHINDLPKGVPQKISAKLLCVSHSACSFLI